MMMLAKINVGALRYFPKSKLNPRPGLKRVKGIIYNLIIYHVIIFPLYSSFIYLVILNIYLG
ncbi:MAG: hypothetical protein RMI53_04880 [Nitrososphaerota archaeon]|nr:hypothetical protein [Nitrososphaerota archaeon]